MIKQSTNNDLSKKNTIKKKLKKITNVIAAIVSFITFFYYLKDIFNYIKLIYKKFHSIFFYIIPIIIACLIIIYAFTKIKKYRTEFILIFIDLFIIILFPILLYIQPKIEPTTPVVPKIEKVIEPTLPNGKTISKYRKDMKDYIKEDYLLNLTINGKSRKKITCNNGETIQIEITRKKYEGNLFFHLVRLSSDGKLYLIKNKEAYNNKHKANILYQYTTPNKITFNISSRNDYEILFLIKSVNNFSIIEETGENGMFNTLSFDDFIENYLKANYNYHQLFEIDIN